MFISIYGFSLEMEVVEFEYLANEMQNQAGKIIYDEDGQACSVLKVETDLESDLVLAKPTVHKKSGKGGVYYFYIRFRERFIVFGAKGYSPLTWKTPRMLTKGKTYKVKLLAKDKVLGDIPINILSRPEDAEKIIDERNLGNGETFKLRKGTYTLKLLKEGYKTIETQIEVNTNNTLFKDYELKQVELVSLQVSSTPDEAEIFINGQSKGKTSTGLWLYPGEYELKLSKETYLDVLENVLIEENKDKELNYTLIKNASYLNLKITPNDAIVKLNDIEYKNRNLEILPGKYTLEISKSSYLTQTEELELNLGKSITKTYTLKENLGYLKLNVTPSSAKIFINKEDKGEQKEFKLAPATYKISVECEGYYAYNEVVSFKLGEKVNKKIVLKAKEGTLLFNVQPLNASVSLLKGEKEIETWQGMKQLKGLLEGEYTIIAKAEGHKTYKKNIIISEKEITNFKAIMEEGSDASPSLITNSIEMEFILIEAGTFQMGSNSGESDEKPIHTVNITKDYYIGKYEVTQGEWKKVMGSNPSYFKGDNLPVERVSWNDVQEFIEKLNQKEGTYKYRLPTEAEWEYASRGGNKSRGYKYSGSNSIGEVAEYEGNNDKSTKPVGGKKANELGIHDMTGNVWEWCSDWYSSGYYSSSLSTDPTGPTSGSYRVLRGGSWYYYASYCRVAFRLYYCPSFSYYYCGFRIVYVHN